MEQYKYDVFISYSRKDVSVANKICGVFDDAGITYFIDKQGIGGGLEFPKVLANAIKGSSLFLFLASKNSYESKFTQSEIVYAFNKKQKSEIIPYIIDDSKLPDELEFTFSAINWRRLEEHPIETVLVNDILSRLGKPKVRKLGVKAGDGESRTSLKEMFIQYRKYIALMFSIAPLSFLFVCEDGSSENVGGFFILLGMALFVWAVVGMIKPSKTFCTIRAEVVICVFVPAFIFFAVGGYLVPVEDSDTNIQYQSDVIIPQGIQVYPINANGVIFNVVKVDGGTFSMGCHKGFGGMEDERVHSVTLDDYYISQTEVTRALWNAVMGTSGDTSSDNLPQTDVSWKDCSLFIDKLNTCTGHKFSLPTEAEWEYAARGGTLSNGLKYSGSNVIDDVAWYELNSAGNTHEVARKHPNELGIYDMSGNVWEWCQDYYSSEYDTVSVNPQGPTNGLSRVRRGGCWQDGEKCTRVSFRSRLLPDNSSKMGVRLVLRSM